MKGAELITEYLIKNDIPYVFGICGHGNVGMLDPLYQARDRITLISPRHEQVAAHMADAYFRVRHKPVATLTSCGPGSCNIIMPLACALTDSSALLAITANVPTQQFNRSPFQEINRHYQADFVNIVRPVVKRSFQPTRVDMLPLALRQAMTTMLSGRPGPVNIDVPFNVFQEEDDVEMPPAVAPLNTQRGGASPEEISRAMEMIAVAQRPVLFIGHGVTLSEASRELTEFAKKLAIPVISSPNGMGCLDMTDPLSLGFIGRNGAYPANEAGRRADLVIAIGARFDDRSASSWLPGFSWNFPHAKLIHVDVDSDELGRNYPPDLPILADARTFLRQLLAEIERRGTNPHPNPPPLAGREGRGLGSLISLHGAPSGKNSLRRILKCTPRRYGPSGLSPTARRCCRPTASSAAMSASATTGTCSSGTRANRNACSIPGAFPAWASVPPARSGPSSPRPIGR
jgi:acetolactate synthase-1/2/3 large subunit